MPAMSQQPEQPATTTFQVAPDEAAPPTVRTWKAATTRLANAAERAGLATVTMLLRDSSTVAEGLAAAERCHEHACGAQEALARAHNNTGSQAARLAIADAITEVFGVMTAAISVVDMLRAQPRLPAWGEPGDDDAAATAEPCEAAS